MGRRNNEVAPAMEHREVDAMRQLMIVTVIILTLGAALVLSNFHENAVLLWAGVTTIAATMIR